MKIIITEGSRDRLVLKWLNKEFGDLTPTDSNDRTYYIDKNGDPLFYYIHGETYNVVYIKDDRIWELIESIFSLNYEQTFSILKEWLGETYNITRPAPKRSLFL